MSRTLYASKTRLKEMQQKLKTIISVFTEVITSKKMSANEISELDTMLNLFFYNIFDPNFYWAWRITLLTDILTVLIKTPLEYSVPKKNTLRLYERLDIMNKVTYYLFQITPIPFSKNLILDFLEYIKGEKVYNYYSLMFYRVNPQLIKDILLLKIADATPKELYFGISTGYFPYREGMSECYTRLVEMVSTYYKENKNGDYGSASEKDRSENIITEYTPLYVLSLLKNDGFISKAAYQKLTDKSEALKAL